MSFHHLSSWYSVGTWKFDLLFAQKPVWDLFPGLLGTFRVVILEFYYQMQQKNIYIYIFIMALLLIEEILHQVIW